MKVNFQTGAARNLKPALHFSAVFFFFFFFSVNVLLSSLPVLRNKCTN